MYLYFDIILYIFHIFDKCTEHGSYQVPLHVHILQLETQYILRTSAIRQLHLDSRTFFYILDLFNDATTIRKL